MLSLLQPQKDVTDAPINTQRINNMSKKLKPCPFCGGEALLSKLSNELECVFKIACIGYVYSDCAGIGLDGYFETKKDAIRSWNVREPDKTISEMRELLESTIICLYMDFSKDRNEQAIIIREYLHANK